MPLQNGAQKLILGPRAVDHEFELDLAVIGIAASIEYEEEMSENKSAINIGAWDRQQELSPLRSIRAISRGPKLRCLILSGLTSRWPA